MLRANPNPRVDEVAPPDLEMRYLSVSQIWSEKSFHREYEPFLVKIGEEVSYTIYRRIVHNRDNAEE
jgi:hypothetical protein